MMINEMLNAMKEFIPSVGYNVVGIDDFELPGEELFFIGNYDSESEAKSVAAKKSNRIVIGSDYEDKNFDLTKELVEAGEDVISESDDYDEFLLETLDKIESKVLKAVKKLGDEVQKDYFEKTFGEFLSGLSNSLNTLPFMKQLRKIIKKDYLKGVEGAESEVDIQIGFTESMDKAINLLEQQQLNGYTINGFSWPGIRGATKKAQVEILNQIQSDLAHKKSISEMSDNVRKIFATTKSGADRIARTETTRIINSGKLDGYKTAKIPRKAYASVMDDKTSDICRRLHNKYFDKGIPVDDLFIDDVTGKAQAGPPFHVNCRCVVEARLGKVSDAKN
jgi:SPP1 gp7 family putative phage head morphogenesis protein